MRKRLVIAAVCILALPLMFSPSRGDNLTLSTPFATVALAGHTGMGGICVCGGPGCECDPGEQPGHGLAFAPSNGSDDHGFVNQDSAPDIDLASGALLIALAFLFWHRMR